jgi:hypothetical protein
MTATTQTAGDNSTKIATTAYVDSGLSKPLILTGNRPQLTLAPSSTDGSRTLIYGGGSVTYNFLTGISYNINNAYEITPSTGAGTSTYSNPALVALYNSHVLINTFSDCGQFFCVNGTIQQQTEKSCSTGLTTDSSGNINGCVASDEHLKVHLTTLRSTDALMKLRPVTYDWADPTKKDNLHHAGFSAQQVGSVFPEAQVHAGGVDGKDLGVDTNAILALLVQQVQKQQREIDSLKKALAKKK